jgi:phage terminase large subunit
MQKALGLILQHCKKVSKDKMHQNVSKYVIHTHIFKLLSRDLGWRVFKKLGCAIAGASKSKIYRVRQQHGDSDKN